jgi:hypothetical protein
MMDHARQMVEAPDGRAVGQIALRGDRREFAGPQAFRGIVGDQIDQTAPTPRSAGMARRPGRPSGV